MAKNGRSLVAIDWDTVGKLLEAHSQTQEIADEFGITTTTLYRRCKQDLGITFVALSQQKKAKGKSRLRAAQYKAAMEGNPTMLIWLGKQLLDQRDKAELGGPNGGPIEHVVRVTFGDQHRIAGANADASGDTP